MKNELLSVAQVFELQPGTDEDPSWVNPGFVAYVEQVKATTVKKGKMAGRAMSICTLRDTTGSATISMTLFKAAPFREGDTIQVQDGGIRRTEYNQLAQVSIGKDTRINVTAGSRQADPPPARQAPPPARQGSATPPPTNGTRINGMTVGMAMKEALAIVRADPACAKPGQGPGSVAFAAEVHLIASDIIRISAMLESGRLAPSPKARAEGHKTPPADSSQPQGGRADPPKAEKPLPGLDGAVALSADQDEDVPF